MRVVIDTNVLISAVLSPASYPHQILTLWEQRQLEFAFSKSIFTEFRRVLLYPHIQRIHGWSVEQVDTYLRDLHFGSKIVAIHTPVHVVQADPTDDKFLACALAAQADALVTGDKQHLLPLGSLEGIPVLTPKAFIERFEAQLKAA